MRDRIDGEYLSPGRFWSLAAGIIVLGAGLSGHQGWRLVEGWRDGIVVPFCKQCSALPRVVATKSPSTYWATMGGHALLVALGLIVLAIGARMAFARITGADAPPEPESDKDRQRRLDRMREEK